MIIKFRKRKFNEKDRIYTQLGFWFGNNLGIDEKGCIRGCISIDTNFTMKILRNINKEEKCSIWIDIAWLWFQFTYGKK